MTSNRWYLGSDGKYHWVNCWLIASCGHLAFFGPVKHASDLSTAELCPECLIKYFDATIPMPSTRPQEATA